MSHERLKHLKDSLLCCVEAQISHLEEVDAEELGEAIDMLKDLEEAIYYTTITEAMKGGDEKKHGNDENAMYYPTRYYSTPTMYMEEKPYYNDGDSSSSNRDGREGRSPTSRKMYMEAKAMHSDKAMQLRELEKYMQELTTDIVEMIQDASPEEKSYLEKKMTTLATKIGSMK
jgi:hypothetical protein